MRTHSFQAPAPSLDEQRLGPSAPVWRRGRARFGRLKHNNYRSANPRPADRRERGAAMQITPAEVAETLAMVSKQNLDIRTITLGINLRGCVDADVDVLAAQGLRPHDHAPPSSSCPPPSSSSASSASPS